MVMVWAVELRRRRAGWVRAVLLLLLPLGLWKMYYWSAMVERDRMVLMLGAVLILLGLWSLWRVVRPFRFVIGPSGLDVRIGRVKAAYGWDEIRTVTLSRS